MLLRVLAKSFSQRGDVLAKICLFYKAVRPYPLHQFRLLDQAFPVFNKNEEQIECFRG